MHRTRLMAGAIIAPVVFACVSLSFAQQAYAKSEADEGTLEEVIVTATKRSESLHDVPMTINVLTEEDIRAAGIIRSSDFLNSIPNVTLLQDDTGETFINIRGQTSSRNSDPNVAIVIDGVTMTSMRDFYQDLLDVQQIEVLKGPQSALYGRNAAAGAIIINTKAPSDEYEGGVTFSYGNFNTRRAMAYIGGPISDELKFRASASIRNTDGPFTDQTSGEKVARYNPTLGRLRLLYTPSDRLTVDLKLGAEKTDGGSLSAAQSQVVGLPLGNYAATKLDANFTDMPFVTNVNGLFDQTYYEATAKIDYAFDKATLSSITAWTDLDTYWGGDTPPYIVDTGVPGSAVSGYAYLDKNYSQEFRLTSPSDQRLRWQVGVYGLRYTRNQFSEFNADILGTVPATRNRIDGPDTPEPTTAFGHQYYKTKSYAVFGNIQYDITEQLHLRLAGRYDKERRTVAEEAPDEINPVTGTNYNLCIALTGRPLSQCHDAAKFKQFEPKVILSWDATPDVTTYVSYGKGFKAGGFNPIGGREAIIAAAVAAGQAPDSVYVEDAYNKEVSKSYEIGVKMRLLDNRLAFNAAAYKTDIEGAQQFQFVPTVGLQTTVSIDKVKVKGFDLDFTAMLPGDVKLFGGYGYADGEVDKFAANPEFNGNVAPNSFKYTLNLGATGTFPVTDDWALTPRVEWNRFGSIWWDVANTPGTKRKPLNLVKARLSLANQNGWNITAWVDNLTNEKYFKEIVPILEFFTVNFRGATRTYGLDVTKRF
ncbi:MAG: TonB-dependent receptor [Lysobacterales bacterium]